MSVYTSIDSIINIVHINAWILITWDMIQINIYFCNTEIKCLKHFLTLLKGQNNQIFRK